MAQKKMTRGKIADMPQVQFPALARKVDAGFADVRGDAKLVLGAIETPSGRMAGIKYSLPSAEDALAV